MKIIQLPHATFTRDKENLKYNLEITLKEALTGFEKVITHLDGHKVTISKPAGQVTSQGEIMKIQEEGMPKYGSPSDFGDLFVTFIVKSPTKLNDLQKEKFKDFFTTF